MKIRTDFVTNSSSSSFILALKGEPTAQMKEAIVNYVMEQMLGEKVLTPENTEDEIVAYCEECYCSQEEEEEIRRALRSGKSIYSDTVMFEDPDDLAYMYENLWKRLEKTGNGLFEIIDGDLSY